MAILLLMLGLVAASSVRTPALAQSTDAVQAAPSVESTTPSPTAAASQTQILSFTSQRAGMMIASDPESSRISSRLSTSSLFGDDGSSAGNSVVVQPLSFSETGQAENGNFDFATSLARLSRTSVPSGFDVWTQAHANLFGSRAALNQSGGNFMRADLGIDYLTTPSVLFGSLVELDSTSQQTVAYPTGMANQGDGQGWMAGPYMALHLLPHLFVDARLAIGNSGNHTDPVANYQDGFSTLSSLSEVKISGGWTFGGLHFDPSTRATFYESRQNSFMDSSAIFVPAQRLTMAQTAFGPTVSYDFDSYEGLVIEPALSVNALWNFQQDASMVEGIGQLQAGVQAQSEFSAQIKTRTGMSLKCSIDYDGIGNTQIHDVKGLVAINMPLPN